MVIIHEAGTFGFSVTKAFLLLRNAYVCFNAGSLRFVVVIFGIEYPVMEGFAFSCKIHFIKYVSALCKQVYRR